MVYVRLVCNKTDDHIKVPVLPTGTYHPLILLDDNPAQLPVVPVCNPIHT